MAHVAALEGSPLESGHRITGRGIEFDYMGFRCLMANGAPGRVCAYVIVPPEHPWHGLDGSEINADYDDLYARADGVMWRVGVDMDADYCDSLHAAVVCRDLANSASLARGRR